MSTSQVDFYKTRVGKFEKNEVQQNKTQQDPRFPLNSESPGYHTTKPLYILPELTPRYRNSVDFGGLAEVTHTHLLYIYSRTPTYELNSKHRCCAP